jgi:formylmethanofuran--tetrahydromethanopterin N-formyltransferase
MTGEAVGGGNLIFLARDGASALAAAEAAVAAIGDVADAIMPFPGGIVRSGSKVGSRYKTLFASTNDAFCPTLRAQVATQLDETIGACLEIVIDGITADAVAGAMRAGLRAAIALGPERGAKRVTAGNYGGKLGPHHFHLRDLID